VLRHVEEPLSDLQLYLSHERRALVARWHGRSTG
jgi:hypothetical protein